MITGRLTKPGRNAVAAVLAALVTGAAGADRIDGPFTFDDKLKVFVVRPNVPVPQRGHRSSLRSTRRWGTERSR